MVGPCLQGLVLILFSVTTLICVVEDLSSCQSRQIVNYFYGLPNVLKDDQKEHRNYCVPFEHSSFPQVTHN